MNNNIVIDFKKPLYGNFCRINGEILDKAIYFGVMVEVNVPTGKGIIDPQKWKDESIKNGQMTSQIFKRPNEPMILYGGWVPTPGHEVAIPKIKKEEKKKELQTKMF